LEVKVKVNQFKNCILLLLVAICTLAVENKALAQSDTSSLFGTVTDTSGAAPPNAKAPVRNDETHIGHTTHTNHGG
jgi:hypothetical protein